VSWFLQRNRSRQTVKLLIPSSDRSPRNQICKHSSVETAKPPTYLFSVITMSKNAATKRSPETKINK
jgi:hypothetical protein